MIGKRIKTKKSHDKFSNVIGEIVATKDFHNIILYGIQLNLKTSFTHNLDGKLITDTGYWFHRESFDVIETQKNLSLVNV